MMLQRALLATLVIAAAAHSRPAAAAAREVRSEVTTVSQGQELIDLKKALDSGAITKDEYDRLRQKALQRGN
ncbi:MAG: SHOCT domain-containing protein [Comamonadaceae bacterium]|nr:SHOCT domain-containing protein [Comamonadaceae bacterium]